MKILVNVSVRRRCRLALGLLFAGSAWSESKNAQLVVQVRPEAALAWQGNSAVLVKVRLTPGAQAKVWAGDSCGAPPVGARLIPASGTYTIPLSTIDGDGKAMVCLSSQGGTSKLPALRMTIPR